MFLLNLKEFISQNILYRIKIKNDIYINNIYCIYNILSKSYDLKLFIMYDFYIAFFK